jgi:flagellar hook-associated protein 2
VTTTNATSGSISFSGLSSGLDTESIVTKLVAVEKAPADLLTTRKSNTTKQLSLVGDFVSKLQALSSAATNLNSATNINAFTSTSADPSRVKVTSSSSAAVGSYNIKVDHLAQAQTTRSGVYTSRDQSGLVGVGQLTLAVGADAAVAVDYDPSDTLDTIASKINGSGARVNASVLFDGTSYRLNVTSKDTGLANKITFGGSGDLLGFDAVDATVVDAKDAQIQLNGTTVTRSSNSMTDVVDGVTFDLQSETPAGGSATTVSVQRDAAGLRAKMQTLVDAFNAVSTAVNNQLTYSGDGTTHKGGDTLFGDPTIASLQRSLASVVAKTYANGTGETSTGQLGIALGRDGKLTIDATKFDAAVSKDPGALVNLLAGPNRDGLSSAIVSMAKSYTDSVDGLLVQKQKSLTSLNASYDKQIDRINTTADSLGTRLRKQFSAMEQTMSLLNSQTSYIDKIFSTKSDS